MNDLFDIIFGIFLTIAVCFVGWVFIQAASRPWERVAAKIGAVGLK